MTRMPTIRMFPLLLGVALATLPALPPRAAQSDYAQDVSIVGNPSPRDVVTGSSINQFGAGQTNSLIDNYLFQDEQINLTEDSGILRVLRTNQKVLVNDFVAAMIPVRNVSPREMRGLARTITRKEGGDADVLWDKESESNYLVVACPAFQIPYLMATLAAIDQEWVTEVSDGSMQLYYMGRHRDVRDIMRLLALHRTADAIWDFDDPNNAVLFQDQPVIGPLFKLGTEQIDIPPSQLALDVTIYEVDTQNNLAAGLDFESWKNGPGRDLFNFVYWRFGGDGMGLFPGDVPAGADWGGYRSLDFLLTTEYLDFLQSKGRARLLTRTTISAKSGTVADVSAVDQIATLRVNTSPAATDLNRSIPYRLDALYEESRRTGAPLAPLGEVLTLAPAAIIQAMDSFLASQLGAGAAARAAVTSQLQALAADGTLTEAELDSVHVDLEVVLRSFRERTLRHLQSGQVGVLLSILPVVGLESAEVALALDVSDMRGQTPDGLPIIEHRYFGSAIELANGKPFVLSGIRRATTVRRSSGVPFLREIPLLGYLFSREVTDQVERELVVVLNPRFELTLAAAVEPPAGLLESVELLAGKSEPQVPRDWFGFDQWLLDPTRR